MSDAAFVRSLKKMSRAELQALWQAEVRGDLDHLYADPRDRLAAWHRRQKREAFLTWLRTLPLADCEIAHRAIIRGDDLDEITKEISAPRISKDR